MDEQTKQQLLPAVVVFNLTLLAYIAVQVLPARRMFFGSLMTHILIGAGIGLVTGGITLAITMLRKR
jgi:protein-S-isoprenylcysteine O-methyltransferase Ste14